MSETRKPFLAMRAGDHYAIGSTPPEPLTRDRRKSLAGTMNEPELLEYLRGQVAALQEAYENAKSGGGWGKAALAFALALFPGELAYLKKKRRLPGEFRDFDLDRFGL